MIARFLSQILCHTPWILAPILLSSSTAAFSQNIDYTLQPGENLYVVARRYLYKPEQWKLLQQLNKVHNPLHLRPGTVLTIPVHLLRPQPANVQVVHVVGDASASTPGQPKDQALVMGQYLPQGSQLTIGDKGFVTLRLADGSTIRLPANTRIQLNEMLYAPASKDIRSTIQLDHGRVESKVTPLPSANSRFEIRTPHAVGGVRGTRFGVALDDKGAFINDVTEGAVLVRSAQSPAVQAMVHAGEGTRLGTTDTQVIVAPLLPAPDLSQLPAIAEDISFVEFTLPALGAASAYQVRIATDTALDQVVRFGQFTQTDVRFEGLDDGTYQLAVRPVDGRGVLGVAASRSIQVKARPEAPFLRQPQQGSQWFSSSIEMLCTENTGITAYDLQVARDAAFRNLVEDLHDLPQCHQLVSDLVPGTYFWRVASVKNTSDGIRDRGPFSKPLSFRIDALPPTPQAPSVAADGATALSIHWGTAMTDGVRFHIQIAHDSNFANILDDNVVETSNYSHPLPPAGVYYVRVQQLDREGHAGAFTSTQSFTVPARLMTSGSQSVLSSDGNPVRPGSH